MSNDTKERFAFGKNWANFLKNINEDRIKEAEISLQKMIGETNLKDKVFLDIGSGSGLFSLAANRLGAKVYSFDYDDDSVNCTKYLRDNYSNDKDKWSVEQGSVLDKKFLEKFGKVDILYSWGVLHHTGDMYKAFENVSDMVREDGRLFISIYNDQGVVSNRWKKVKKMYNTGKGFTKKILLFYTLFRTWIFTFLKDFMKSGNPLRTWNSYGCSDRGMSPWYDIIDWVGGYPFEVAKPEEVFEFFKKKGFKLEKIKTCAGGLGCNEFVFLR